jgi:AraC-like DNA-binding protein
MNFSFASTVPALRGQLSTDLFPDEQGLENTGSRPAVAVTLLGEELCGQLHNRLPHVRSLLHARSVAEVLRLLREHSVRVLLSSPDKFRADGICESRLRAALYTLRPVAVVNGSSHEIGSCLRLGALGFREAVDVRSRQGWIQLRNILEEEVDPLTDHIRCILRSALGATTPGMHRFLGSLVRLARTTAAVRALAHVLHVQPSTLISRFYRARLPSPKRLLVATRLMFARALLQEPCLSIASVAYELRYSSPQSFGRHVRQTLGVSAAQFRSQFSFGKIANHFVDSLVVRYREGFVGFDPFRDGSGRKPIERDDAPPAFFVH